MNKTVHSIGLKEPKTLSEDKDTVRLIEEMRKGKQGAFPILEDGKIGGIATSRDVLSELPKLMRVDEFLGRIQNEEI